MDFPKLDPAGERWRLTFRRELAHAPEKVWRAVTEPEHLAAWFPSRIDGERQPGARLQFVFEGDEGPTLEGEVLVFEPPRVFEFTWAGDRIRIEVEPTAGGSVLHMMTTFDEYGRIVRDGAGWHFCLENLVAHLQGSVPPAGNAWKEFETKFTEHFGPEAATIGPPEGALD